MKRTTYFLNSYSVKIVLFLCAFAVGVVTNALFEPTKSTHPTVPLYQQEQPPEKDRNSSGLASDDNKEPSANSKPKIVQSSIINFPKSGRVIVQAREQAGEFPEMIFVSAKTGKVLLRSSVKDKSLIPDNGDWIQPALRFRVIHSPGFNSPMVMAVGLQPGVSDDGFYLTVFGEVAGKLRRLNNAPLAVSIQGGYYLGHLNKRLGSGLVVWDFIWGRVGTDHYGEHRYTIEIYQLQNRRFVRTLKRISRKKYSMADSSNSLRELGIAGNDQRNGVPRIRDFLN